MIDQGTLHDLDVFTSSAAGGLTLLALLDRTRSTHGKEALRQRISSPVATISEIILLQEAHQELGGDLNTFRVILDRVEIDSVIRYLTSPWQTPRSQLWPARVVASIWSGIKYPDYMKEIESGNVRVYNLLQGARDLQESLANAKSALLRELSSRFGSSSDSNECRELIRVGELHSGPALLAFDQLARGKAKEQLLELTAALGELEAMWSVASATVEQGWVYPVPGERLRIRGLYHPFLAGAAVRNDFELAAGVRVCFMTGPNMAGKSTFLKAIAVAFLLAQIGAGAPVTSMEFPPVNALFSSIQIVDNLRAGESFYLAEVRRIRKLATTVKEHRSAIVVVDEPFRGTNVHDATEATLAIITRLAAHQNVLSLVASHLGEIGPLIADDPRMVSLHFAADVNTEPPQFDFRLREGVSTQRLGMILLRQEKVLELLDNA